MEELKFTTKSLTLFFWLSLLAGISLRLWISTIGHNFDLESFWLVSEAVVNGRSVYAETARYNYGPIWYLLLGIFRQIAIAFNADNISAFHVLIAAFLTFVDIVIALMLRENYGVRASLFFFLNPVSILITGYHSQFDNFAILIAFVACSEFSKQSQSSELRRATISMSLLGLSLATKHICFFLPLWLWIAHRNSSAKLRTSILVASYGIFALFFLPFAWDSTSVSGIKESVLNYGSIYGNGLIFQFLNLFINIKCVETLFNLSLTKHLFILLTIFSGAFWGRRDVQNHDLRELFFIYIITLVAFTPSMADQYLAIPLIALARFNKYKVAWIYSLAATVALLTSMNNLFMGKFSDLRFIGYQQTQVWLFILLVIIWRQTTEKIQADGSKALNE